MHLCIVRTVGMCGLPIGRILRSARHDPMPRPHGKKGLLQEEERGSPRTEGFEGIAHL